MLGRIALLGLTVAVLFQAITAADVTVSTSAGSIKGTSESVLGVNVDIFLGIPFAEPPVGPERFKAPKPKNRWTGTRDALAKPNACPQDDLPPGLAEHMAPKTAKDEDCLYLNVWAPSGDVQSPRAVMVFIHGGGFTQGSSNLDVYDARIMAAKYDVVIVSMNYRVNIFGFLYLGNNDAPGNMGLMDQQLALQWVQDNIRHFKGDPARVTIFGESAGSASVHFHMISPPSAGLYNNAIMESGLASAPWASLSPEAAAQQVKAITRNLKCNSTDTTTCLMTSNVNDLLKAVTPLTGVQMLPVYKTDTVPDNPYKLLQEGKFQKKKCFTGTNQNEGTFFIPFSIPEMMRNWNVPKISRPSYDRRVMSMLQIKDASVAERVSLGYGVPKEGATVEQMFDALDAIFTDSTFVCPQGLAIPAMIQHNAIVYEYQYNLTFEYDGIPSWMGATHGNELFHVFAQAYNETAGNSNDAENKRLTDIIGGYWTNFAKTGDPNEGPANDLPQWLPHNQTVQGHLVMQAWAFEMKPGYRQGKCELLASIYSTQAPDTSGANVITTSPSRYQLLLIALIWVAMQYYLE